MSFDKIKKEQLDLEGLQATLQSGTNIKTVGGQSLLGSGDIPLPVSGVITTTLQLASIPTESVAGFVTYLNTLATPLVLASNEIFKLQLTASGRVFELRLRGRSFGVGQAAIVASDVLDVTDFLNKDVRLSNYPITRNDGQLPSNKVLTTDVNGNLKMYSIAIAPAPYLYVLIPDSRLPNTTGLFILIGSFFTPTMTVVIGGCVVNSFAFISSNEVKVTVTTGPNEGSFPVTLNNGLSATFNNALLIVLGTVYVPTAPDWELTNAYIDVQTTGKAKFTIAGTVGTGQIKSAFYSTHATNDFQIVFNFQKSPLYNVIDTGNNQNSIVQLCRVSDNAVIYQFSVLYLSPTFCNLSVLDVLNANQASNVGVPDLNSFVASSLAFKRINGVLGFHVNDVLKKIFTTQNTTAMYLKTSVKWLDLENIKLIVQ